MKVVAVKFIKYVSNTLLKNQLCPKYLSMNSFDKLMLHAMLLMGHAPAVLDIALLAASVSLQLHAVWSRLKC